MDANCRQRRKSDRIINQDSKTSNKRKRQQETDGDVPLPSKPKMGNEKESKKVDFSLDDLKAYMDGDFRKKIDEDNQKTINSLTNKIDKTQSDLNSHKMRMDGEMRKIREEMANVTALVTSKLDYQAPTGMNAASRERSGQNERQYWFSRKCSRMFPVEGKEEKTLWGNLEVFLKQKLMIPSHDICREDVVDVRRMRMSRGSKDRAEVLVVFKDVETRDRITSYARNLSTWIDITGKPTAVLRLDVPTFLGGAHRTLTQYGHAIWLKYNKSKELKRNVRFDDSELTFCMGLKLPKNEDWITVTYEQALADRRARTRDSFAAQGDRLSTRRPSAAGEEVFEEALTTGQADGMDQSGCGPNT